MPVQNITCAIKLMRLLYRRSIVLYVKVLITEPLTSRGPDSMKLSLLWTVARDLLSGILM